LGEVLTTPPREKKNPVKKYSQGEMIPLETKQSGGKLLPHSDLWGGSFSRGGKMDLREVGGGGDWMELAQDRDRWRALVNTVMNLQVP